MGGPAPFKVRQVAPDEIRASRGTVEDNLRKRLLSLLSEEEVLLPVREVLNRTWDEEGVRYLCNMAFSYERSARPRPTFEGSQRDAALDLLAYVHTAYKDDVAANKATQLIRRNFDALFGSIASNSDNWPLFFRSAMYGLAVNAIRQYGSAALLTPGFWECFETFQQGFAGLRAVRAVGDKEALARLERLEETLRAWQGRERFLQESIRDVKARLGREHEPTASETGQS
jgi:hypothetical protein